MEYTTQLIEKYFDNELTDRQREQFAAMGELYKEWNSKINVVSRKDIDNIYLHHILHSLAIAKVVKFPPNSTVLDIGCGGGFPGVPLATLFPEVNFKLVDSIGKKITVVKEVSSALGLTNIEAFHSRVEELPIHADYIISRAVTMLKPFMDWSWGKLKSGDDRGLIYLKGGDLTEEIAEGLAGKKKVSDVTLYNISELFDESFFETKKVLYIKKG